MFVYDLSRELVARGHKVTVMAHAVGGEVTKRGRETGVSVVPFGSFRNPVDVLHVHGAGPSHWAINHVDAPAVATVHSTLVYETPLVDDRIRHYACVRPEIQEKIITQDGVPREKTSVVFNGVDTTRFVPGGEKFDTPTILFAGTVDYLRAQAAHMTWDIAWDLGWEVLFVGRRLSGHLDDLPPHVRYQEGDIWNIESLVQRCSATSGILLGRTLLEGWACGIPGYVFEIDNDGQVMSWGLYEPPPPQLMAVFDSRYMAECYERLYERIQ